MRRIVKRIGALVLATVMAVAMIPAKGADSYAAGTEITGYTASELTTMFSMGYNIGNTMDALGGNKNDILSQEKSWGNPAINKDLMHGIAEAGFTFVRIPITWEKHVANDDKNTIDEAWLARVKEVVDYAYDEGLFVIINIHHDNTWLNVSDLSKKYKTIGKKLGNIWSQIADYFADYDQRLIFESMNEPRAVGTNYEWTGTQECYDAINYLNQVFVDTIRGNGKGHNSERALMIPGYAASNSSTVLSSIKIPTWKGKQAENVIVAVHCYSPYDFCLSDKQIDFNPERDADTSDVVRMFRDFKRLFLDNGIPVILGECGATRQGDNFEAREIYFDWFGKICRQYGVPAALWDNGVDNTSGGENHYYLSRVSGVNKYPALVTSFISGKPLSDLNITFESTSGVKTPREYGLSPSTIMLKIRVNHTAGVTNGYSASVGKGVPDGTVYLDIKDYKKLKVKISAYVSSADAEEKITMGLSCNGETTEYTSVTVAAGDWKGMGFAAELPDSEDVKVFFKSENGNYYYIDDIAVEMVESLDGILFEFNDLVAGETANTETSTETSTGTSTETSTTVSTGTTTTVSISTETTDVNKEDQMKTVIWIGAGIFALAVIVMIMAFVLSKKNSKEDK